MLTASLISLAKFPYHFGDGFLRKLRLEHTNRRLCESVLDAYNDAI